MSEVDWLSHLLQICRELTGLPGLGEGVPLSHRPFSSLCTVLSFSFTSFPYRLPFFIVRRYR
jgi:hypothetical protein